MPNNRHRAKERYTRSRYLRRLRAAARKAFLSEALFGESFSVLNRVSKDMFVLDPGNIKFERLNKDIIMVSPGGPRVIASSLSLASAAARADDIKHILIAIDSPGDYIGELPEGKRLPGYDSFVKAGMHALTEHLLTGKMPEIKFDNEEVELD